MDFDEYQRNAKGTSRARNDRTPEERQHKMVFGLVAEAGLVGDLFKKRIRDGNLPSFEGDVGRRLGHCLWYAAMLTDSLGLNLSDLAQQNLDYNADRWGMPGDQPEMWHPNFDDGVPEDQKFPRKFWVKFEDEEVKGVTKTSVMMYLDGPSIGAPIQFGDPVDDNSREEDFYRYHDAFHFTYAAMLGWSPVVRKFLVLPSTGKSIKRKDSPDPHMDRIDDGARARDLEEAVTSLVFKVAKAEGFYESHPEHPTTIDTGVLDIVRVLVSGLEVQNTPLKQWERTILEACRVYRELVSARGGTICVDLNERKISVVA